MPSVTLQFSEVEYKLIDAMAAFAKKPIKEYLRQIVLSALSSDLQEVGREIEEVS